MAIISPKQDPLPHLDGWRSEITNLGTAADKRTSYNITPTVRFSQPVLESTYRDDFLARKTILLPPKDATREQVDFIESEVITADVVIKIKKKDKALKLWPSIRKALQWSRLYGGGVAVMIIEDGRESHEPVDVNNIKTVRGIYSLDAFQIAPVSYQNNPSDPNFGEPDIYRMTATSLLPSTSITTRQSQIVTTHSEWHRSRLMVFDGIDLPNNLRLTNDGWGDSIIQAIYNTLRNYHQGQDGSASLVSDFAQAVFKINDLHNKVASGSGDVVASRMNLINLSRSLINAVVIDADNEEFKREAPPLTGLDGLLKQFERAVVAASDIPHTILFGDSPSGLGASGLSEEKTYKDSIKAMQEDKIRPELDIYYNYLALSQEFGLEAGDIGYEFPSLFQQTQKEQAEVRKTISTADKNNVGIGIYTAEEARTRYEGDGLNMNVTLSETSSE